MKCECVTFLTPRQDFGHEGRLQLWPLTLTRDAPMQASVPWLLFSLLPPSPRLSVLGRENLPVFRRKCSFIMTWERLKLLGEEEES